MFSGLITLVLGTSIAGSEVQLQKIADSIPKPVSSQITTNTTNTSSKRVVTYDVSTRGNTVGALEEFKKVVADTFADSRGWVRANVTFKYVESGGQLHMILAEPSVVGALGGCSSQLSCTVKPSVYINDDRYMGASESYRELGVSVANYRTMVINHEVGHWLGHNHITTCETNTGLAPIMLQQSTGLRGCRPNYWPLSSELWTNF